MICVVHTLASFEPLSIFISMNSSSVSDAELVIFEFDLSTILSVNTTRRKEYGRCHVAVNKFLPNVIQKSLFQIHEK